MSGRLGVIPIKSPLKKRSSRSKSFVISLTLGGTLISVSRVMLLTKISDLTLYHRAKKSLLTKTSMRRNLAMMRA